MTIISGLLALNLPKKDINSYLSHLKQVGRFVLNEQITAVINQLEVTIHKMEQDIRHNGAITPIGDNFIRRIQELIHIILNP